MKFQKGNKMSKGRQSVPDDVRGLKLMNQRELELIINKMLDKSVHELVAFTQDFNNNAKEVMIARIVAESIKHGDQNRLDFILNRIIGKPKEVHDHNHNVKVSYHAEIMKMIHDAEAIDVTPKQIPEDLDEDEN